ncbi:hypothetical protein ACXET9_11760 [Brachybacterium sp. DNPG3]
MKKGMNPVAVEQMATSIDDAVETIQELFTTLQGQVTDLDWTGDDRDRFVSDFSDTVGGAAQRLAQQGGDLAERGRTNATAQRNASA